jgi:hypothetical protein
VAGRSVALEEVPPLGEDAEGTDAEGRAETAGLSDGLVVSPEQPASGPASSTATTVAAYASCRGMGTLLLPS